MSAHIIIRARINIAISEDGYCMADVCGVDGDMMARSWGALTQAGVTQMAQAAQAGGVGVASRRNTGEISSGRQISPPRFPTRAVHGAGGRKVGTYKTKISYEL